MIREKHRSSCYRAQVGWLGIGIKSRPFFRMLVTKQWPSTSPATTKAQDLTSMLKSSSGRWGNGRT
jgi:hypothetical protein